MKSKADSSSRSGGPQMPPFLLPINIGKTKERQGNIDLVH